MINKLFCTKPLSPHNAIKPLFKNTLYIDRADLSKQLNSINDIDCKTILNLDLDYFFDEYSGKQINSNLYIDDILKTIAKKYKEKKFNVLPLL